MNIREPATAAEWETYFDLRWRVLRAPWQQPRGSERDAQDPTASHCLIQDNDKHAIAIGRLHINSPAEAQIRFMAVAPDHQGQGLGRTVLAELERRARQAGVSRIVLNARDSALAFYRKYGFQVVGPAHSLFGSIAHTRMEKQIDGKKIDVTNE